MARGFLKSLFKTTDSEVLVSIDIGTSAIKVMELDVSDETPKLISAASTPTPSGSIANNTITRPDQIAAAIRSLLDANEIKSQEAVICLPGPTAFVKKVTLAATRLDDLADNIAYEAGNFIPHKIDAVHMDYQVLRRMPNGSLEVLLVAVKNEIINSYLDSVIQAGLEPAIADVDYFALENAFELNYPEEREKTIALVNIGSRYSSVNIMQNGASLFTGDVSVGGRLYTDALCETLSMEPKVAEKTKMGDIPAEYDANLIAETLERTTEHIAAELHRQLGFFWNASATDKSIDAVYISGGGSLAPGLLEELSAKTGITCKPLESFKVIDTSSGFDEDFLREIGPQMAVSVGLSSRRNGDKQHAIDD
jgi:type IV pilus assembly protein PilM